VRHLAWADQNAALAAISAAVVGVIMNLALWFALHVLFAQMTQASVLGLTLEVPVAASLKGPSALLTLAAAVAAFGFGPDDSPAVRLLGRGGWSTTC
jgi:chromate transporter